uniref:hypothetical protein n=1 Tax=Neorhizobium sp. EC2-8 TaxID=3129230 RepID=UPI003101556F
MRPGKYFLPPTWPGSLGGKTHIPAGPDFGRERAGIARARIAAAEALATGESLIEAIRASIEDYGLTKGEADGRQNRQG